MGFNIGVASEKEPTSLECDHFINRSFYNFVNSGEQYGDESILIRSGQYYGLDLSCLLKLVYTWDEVPDDYIKTNLQTTNTLLNLIETFRDKIQKDNSVCDKIEYTWHDTSFSNTLEESIQNSDNELNKELIKMISEMINAQKSEAENNPNPWKSYFEEGQIIGDLDNLIKSLRCFKDKGVTQIYLTAG
jgi:hypothetical protein